MEQHGRNESPRVINVNVNVSGNIHASKGSAVSLLGSASILTSASESLWGSSQLQDVLTLTRQEWLLDPSRVDDALTALRGCREAVMARTVRMCSEDLNVAN
jgi:hypothetical protein